MREEKEQKEQTFFVFLGCYPRQVHRETEEDRRRRQRNNKIYSCKRQEASSEMSDPKQSFPCNLFSFISSTTDDNNSNLSIFLPFLLMQENVKHNMYPKMRRGRIPKIKQLGFELETKWEKEKPQFNVFIVLILSLSLFSHHLHNHRLPSNRSQNKDVAVVLESL